MTEQNGKSEAADIQAADLDLVAALADAGKDETELWNEIAAEEKTAEAKEPVGDGNGTEAPDAAQRQQKPAGEAIPGKSSGEASQPDIWATATPEQRAAYEAERAEREKLAHRVSSDAGRVAALQRRYEELKKAAQPKEPGRQPAKDPKEVLAALKEEYPDIAEPLSQALEQLNGTVQELNQAEEGRREAAAKALKQTEAEIAEIIEAETNRLTEAHPDWEAFLKEHGGNKLAAWIDDQPRRIREAFAANGNAIVDADAAITFLDAYKKFVNPDQPAGQQPGKTDPSPNQPLNDRRQRQLAATATPSGKGGKPVVAGIPEDGDPEAIWKAFAEEDRRKGAAA